MAANVKVYTDSLCSNELLKVNGVYSLVSGPIIGMDGDSGASATNLVYLKNVGDQAALFITVRKENEDNNFVSFSAEGNVWVSNNIAIRDLAVGDSEGLYVQVNVPSGTHFQTVNPNYIVRFKTLP